MMGICRTVCLGEVEWVEYHLEFVCSIRKVAAVDAGRGFLQRSSLGLS